MSTQELGIQCTKVFNILTGSGHCLWSPCGSAGARASAGGRKEILIDRFILANGNAVVCEYEKGEGGRVAGVALLLQRPVEVEPVGAAFVRLPAHVNRKSGYDCPTAVRQTPFV